jgi:hypothetical protein
MKTHVKLTVSESKRLIAKGVVALPEVRAALQTGMIALGTGSTNSYVYEELLGTRIDRAAYRSGLILPSGKSIRDYPNAPGDVLPDLILRNGRPAPNLDRFRAIQEMKRGDVFIKGANALSADRRLAGVLIGAENGGTIGATLGHVLGKGIVLIIPVGLEKLVCDDLMESARTLLEADSPGPRLAPLPGKVVTEIEALALLTGVCARQIAAGGVGGAEGGVWLLLQGTDEEVKKTQALVDGIHGEPPWLT